MPLQLEWSRYRKKTAKRAFWAGFGRGEAPYDHQCRAQRACPLKGDLPKDGRRFITEFNYSVRYSVAE
jgi:hypothetical protein